jgi:hypothetical protein
LRGGDRADRRQGRPVARSRMYKSPCFDGTSTAAMPL